jgi:hypothetical protein
MGNTVGQFAGKSKSSKSSLNLAKVSSNACQRSEDVAGAKTIVYTGGLLNVALLFFVTATSVFFVGSSALAGFLFSLIKLTILNGVWRVI